MEDCTNGAFGTFVWYDKQEEEMTVKHVKDRVMFDVTQFEKFMIEYEKYMTQEEKEKCVELYKDLVETGDKYIKAAKNYYQRQN